MFDNFGICDNEKTFNVDIPKNIVNEDCAKAYVLGCLDGDGCISHLKIRRPTIVLTTASEKFVLGIISIIKRYLPDVSISYLKHKYSTLSVSKRSDVRIILDWVYSSSIVLKLRRKYEKYLLVKEIV